MDLTISEAFVLNAEERRRRLRALRERKTLKEVIAQEREEKLAEKLKDTLIPLLEEGERWSKDFGSDKASERSKDSQGNHEALAQVLSFLAKRIDDLTWEISMLRGQIAELSLALQRQEDKNHQEGEANPKEADEETQPAISTMQ